MTSSRNHALDGLRGIAALAVALGHCSLAVTGLPIWFKTVHDFPAMPAAEIIQRLLYVLCPSDAAVTLFFVLSGHVLWESFVRNGSGVRDFPDYIVGRAYRLLPVAIVTALPLGFLTEASASALAANMLLLSYSINGVLWSLRVEVVCSLAIFVAWTVTRGSLPRLLALLALMLAMAPAFRGSNFFLFFPAFLLGASISAMPQRIWRRSTFFVSLACLVLASLFLSHAAISRLFEMLGAVGVIGCTRANPLPGLMSRPVQFLGAVSYPFYLSHGTALILCERMRVSSITDNSFGQIAVLALVSVPLAILIAWLFHVFVELPAMRARPRIVPAPSPSLAPAT